MRGLICMHAFCTARTITTRSRRYSKRLGVRLTPPLASTNDWAVRCRAPREHCRNCKLQIANCKLSKSAICNLQFAIRGGAESVRIVLDAAGGDHAPEQPVRGAVLAARELGCQIVLVGPEAAIRV